MQDENRSRPEEGSAPSADDTRPRRRIPLLALLPPLLFLVIAGFFYAGLGRDDQLPSTMIGRAAPAVKVAPLGDLPVLTDDMIRAPEVKLVNFWASWCLPCRVEHAQLMEMNARGVKIYGVNYKDKPENGLGFLAELGNPFHAVGADRNGRMAIDWGVYGVPETFVIDPAGKVVLRFAGPITRDVMDNTILPAIEKAAGKP